MTDTTDRLANIAPAIEQLTNHQTQLDMDGCMVGVSRQALEEVLSATQSLAADTTNRLAEVLDSDPDTTQAWADRCLERMRATPHGPKRKRLAQQHVDLSNRVHFERGYLAATQSLAADNADLTQTLNSVVKMYVAAEKREALLEATAAWDWLAEHPSLELTHGADDIDEDGEWRVHQVNGGYNDREWKLVGRGETPLEAVQSARATLNPTPGDSA